MRHAHQEGRLPLSGVAAAFPGATTPRDFGSDAEGRARRWAAEIEKAHKEAAEWFRQCRTILERYKDMGPGRQGVGQNSTFGMRFNIFWSNVQTLAPSLYASTPKVVVERRWDDPDDVGRIATVILQRAAQYQLDVSSDFDALMRACVLDHLIAGRGTAWVRYEPHFDRADPAHAPLPAIPLLPPVTPPILGAVPGPAAPVPPPGAPQPAGMAGAVPSPPTPGAAVAPPPPVAPGAAPVPGGVLPPSPAGAGGGAPPAMPPPMPMAAPGGIPIGHLLHEGPVIPDELPRDGGVQVADDGEQDNAERLAYEEVKLDHVHWEDFLSSPARTWMETRWVARRAYLTKDEVRRRFGARLADAIPYDWLPKDLSETEALQPEHQLFRRAQIYEIWDKPSRKVYWLAHNYTDELLDERVDPLQLSEFFPCPRPLYATLTTETTIPVPDYAMYRDQAVQIDVLTARIEAVAKSIKVTGVYDSAQDGIQRMFAEGVENQLIPVNQWGSFSEQGGLKGCMDLLDVGMLSEVLGRLVEIRSQAKQDLYEVTGISDIIRGTTAASETATAQQIKAGFGTMRLRSRQNEVARFARDLIRITCEIICTHFQPKTMLLISDVVNYAKGADMPFVPAAFALLRDDKTRPLRIDIEADSTILANQQQEQQQRIQFLTMAGQFLQQSLPAVQQHPQLAPLLGQMLLFGIRSFPAGAELEAAFEQAVDQLEKLAAQPQQGPPPDPKLIVANAQVQNIQSQIADRQMRSQADAQSEQALARERMMKIGIDKQKADDANAARSVDMFHDHEQAQRDFLIDAAKLRIEAEKARQQSAA